MANDSKALEDKLIKLFFVLSSVIFFYTTGFGGFTTLTQRALHWAFMGTGAFLILKPKSVTGKISKYVFAILTFITSLYVIITLPQRIFGVNEISSLDVILGVMAIISLLVSLKLSVGWGLTITAAFFLFYAVYGRIFPGFLGHSGVRIPRLINFLYLTTEGIFGIALGTSATYIIGFVIFGSVLSSLGGGEWFVDVAYALTGRYRGGPAKTSVIASALMGTISGSPIANVVTTGTFTIPLMKRIGYPPEVAGAVEAVASTGGMFMPPVMGAGAFIMAEYLNIPYLSVAKAALVPSLLYYFAIFMNTDVRAVKLNLKGLPKEQLPDIKTAVFKRGYHALPLIFLIVVIIVGWSPLKSVFWATIMSLAISFFALRNPKEWLKRVINAFANASKECVPIAVACAGAGIIVGVIGVTGLGTKIADGLINFANGNLVFALILGMIAAIILGTGMPITAVYIICAATLVPPLISMGCLPIAAHMFIFMFSAVAGLTPPVAITAYTAAGLAKTDPSKTAIQAFLYGLPGYIIPFIFALSPELLLVGETWKVIIAVITAVFGILCLVAAIEGYFIIRWHPVLRVFLFFAAILLLDPGIITDLIAIGIVIICFLLQMVFSKFSKPTINSTT